MCGIAGIVSASGGPPPTPDALRAMCAALYHRGPDEEGRIIDGPVALGMRRLSIIDVAGGSQPIFNEDRTVRVVFNGEIYNFRELRRELEAKGHRFASATDGEVIVHLWEEYGADFPSYLNGMFGIALHDTRRRKVLLVRDRLGIKPLYYCRTATHLVFGSEIKAVLASGLVERRLDLDALGQFLAWEYVPAPQTLFQGLHKLEPGSTLEVDLEDVRPRLTTWWDVGGVDAPCNGALPRSEADWEDAIDAKIREAVRRQLVSDVPLGAFLSGGVDSSLVVAGMGEAKAFSIGFDDPSYSELPWAAKVARHLGVDHKIEIIRPDVIALFHHLMQFMDDPIGDFSIFPTYLVSRLARQQVKVVLSGDGGDELFGGYDTYVAQAMAARWNRLPSVLRKGIAEPIIDGLRPRAKKKGLVNKAKRFVEGVRQDSALGHARWRLFADAALQSRLFTPEAAAQVKTDPGAHIRELFERAGPRSDLDRGLYVDLKSYLSDNCLVKVDRMSMACSLEARVPFLDHELVELAFAMPDRLKVDRGQTKRLLKRVAARHVPHGCVYRTKQGFSIPIKNWLKTEFRPLMEDMLAPARLASDGVFQADVVERIKQEHLADQANHSHLLWALLVFQDWRQRWSV